MTRPRPSTYRDALKVSPERIAALGEDDLNVLMNQLIQAQSYRCGSPANEIRINTEDKAKDDGCDGWSGKPVANDAWLGSAETCWQFKAGLAGEPARLTGEVTKRIPSTTLANGGRFVVVASGSKNGKKGEDDRLKKLTNEAVTAGIPAIAIHVIGSERLSEWCNQHPAVAAQWAGRPSGLWSFDDWSNSDEHQVPWQGSTPVEGSLDAFRGDLDFETGSVFHLHIQGPPGVGKTRFALELCRDAKWRGSVIYVRQTADLRLAELIDDAAADPAVQLTVVADEVQPDQLRPLRDSVGRGSGRVRLITIGLCPTPDPARIPAYSIKPLEAAVMSGVIKGLHPGMPPEHVDFVVRFADGYVRLARLAADAVVLNPKMDVRGLLSREEIRHFLDGMLGTGDRRALYVVAVMKSVGWEGDKQVEGETVARQFGLDWNAVRASVDDFHRRLGIVPRGGRYRYISPAPLATHLAVEAWTTYPDILKALPQVLGSDDAKGAYYERLQTIASNPQARQYARDELAFFFRIDDFVDARAVRRWSALSSADAILAARSIRSALTSASPDDRRRIEEDARREAVWGLVHLAWGRESFHDSVTSLALLAEAENETWANNATGEFIARFQIYLGGTAAPYLERLSVLDALLVEGRPSLTRLVVKALAQVGNQSASRTGSGPMSDALPVGEWQPRTREDHIECVETAISRLCDIAKRGIPEIQTDLVAAADNLSMMLRVPTVSGAVISFFDAVRASYPMAREPLRRIIADIVHREKKHWKELSADQLEELETLHGRFEDQELASRLQQHVGHVPWDREGAPDLSQLAGELISGPNALLEHWPWLTSGEASDAWRLGEALAAADAEGTLAEKLPFIPGAGPDFRLLCGYISARRRVLGDDWYDAWVALQCERSPVAHPLLFEVVWRCGATDSVARRLAEVLRTQSVDEHIVAQLGFGRWGDQLSFEALEMALRAMADTGHGQTAIGILAHRLKFNDAEVNRWKPLALELVTSSVIIRSSQIVSYQWQEVAKRLVADYPGQIAGAIFREQADRKPGTWFAEFSDAATVLQECVRQDSSAVWNALHPHLSSPTRAYSFSIGFPRGILQRMPPDAVGAWIAENPEERAMTVARLVSKDMSTDQSLAARIIGMYGDTERVAGAFFSEYVSGSWSGSNSAHWDELAESLDEVAGRTALPKLRRWAADSARSLREMAERERHREEEDELRAR